MALVYFGLGTNLGDRLKNLQGAVAGLEQAGVCVGAISPVYETPPWGMVDQPAFLNVCVSGRVKLLPTELLAMVKGLEQSLGRERGERWGPRLIDIDILFYDDVVLATDGLTIPHPGLAERAFVLAPLQHIAPDLRHPQLGKRVADLWAVLPRDSSLRRYHLPIRWGRRTWVMGIVNVTPDSFSGDGVLGEGGLERALAQVVGFVEAGVDVVDIGGESTRPGSVPITAEEEIARVVPLIRAVREAMAVPISIDTYRADVAEAGLAAGADWVNDVWGLRMDGRMASVVAEAGCPVVLMHNRSKPKNVEQEATLGGRYVGVKYGDLIGDIKRELQESVDLALAQGVRRENIIVDPGVGFGKTVGQNVRLLDELDRFKTMGYPILLGSSRKSFIGYTLNLPPHERVEGTAATVAIGIDRGADIVRVHDVKEMVRVARMTDRIIRVEGRG